MNGIWIGNDVIVCWSFFFIGSNVMWLLEWYKYSLVIDDSMLAILRSVCRCDTKNACIYASLI